MPIGPFKLDAQGLLTPATVDSFPGFKVRWRERTVHARMVKDTDTATVGRLEFSGILGRVPSTAKSPPHLKQRDSALSVLRTLPALMPPGWAINLSPDHSVILVITTPLDLPTSAVSLITKVTLFLLALSPYLNVLDEEGVSFAAGMAKT